MVFAEQPNMSEPNPELKNFAKNHVIEVHWDWQSYSIVFYVSSFIWVFDP